VVSVTDPYGRILGFLDRSGYYFLQIAPQLYSRVVTVPGCRTEMYCVSCEVGDEFIYVM
jgi:hypothetical protein